MVKSPAFQFYPDDFLGSGKVGTMTTEEVGAYALLLCLEWNETGFVYDEEELARWCRMPRLKFRKAWVRVSRCFMPRDGKLFNPRLDAEREKQTEWREKSRKGGVAGAKIRWENNKGGITTPIQDNKPNRNGGSTTVIENGLPNDDTPSPSPTPVTTNNKKAAPAASPDERVVLDHFAAVHPQRRLSTKHVGVVRRALALGYSPGDLVAAIDGNACEEWHRKRHKHELSYVLRSTDQIDTFRAKAAEAKEPLVDAVTGLPTERAASILTGSVQ